MDLKIERQVPEEAMPENPNAFIEIAERAEKQSEAFQKAQEQKQAEMQGRSVGKAPERCNEVEFSVGDLTIKMSRPKFPVTMRVNRILNHETFDDPHMIAIAMEQIKALLHVSHMNGEEISRPCNMIEVESLLQNLGTDGSEAVVAMYQECFPGLTRAEIKIIKKT